MRGGQRFQSPSLSAPHLWVFSLWFMVPMRGLRAVVATQEPELGQEDLGRENGMKHLPTPTTAPLRFCRQRCQPYKTWVFSLSGHFSISTRRRLSEGGFPHSCGFSPYERRSHRLCPTDLARKFARPRNLSGVLRPEALSRWHPGQEKLPLRPPLLPARCGASAIAIPKPARRWPSSPIRQPHRGQRERPAGERVLRRVASGGENPADDRGLRDSVPQVRVAPAAQGH